MSEKQIKMTNHYDDNGAYVRLEIDGKWIADFNKRKYVQEYIEALKKEG